MRAKPHPCKNCGAPIPGKNGSRVYCSRDCRDTAPRQVAWNKGISRPPFYWTKNGDTRNCNKCGGLFYRTAQEIKNRPSKYCSTKCYQSARWGESHVVFGICQVCGTEFKDTASALRKVCSWECRNKLKGITQQGELSHFWRGGAKAPYVGEWKMRRREALERDEYRCVLCGNEMRVNVHHIVPFRYSKSHDLENLQSLCRSCHSREELKVNHHVDGLTKRWHRPG